MNGCRRSSAIIFSVIFICLVLLAGCLIVAEYGHDCLGEKCNVCCVIDAAQKLLDGLTAVLLVAILFVASKFNFHNFLRFIKKYLFSTPILLKVKLSD